VNTGTNTYFLTRRTTTSYNGLQSVADTVRFYDLPTSTWTDGALIQYTRNGFGAVTQKIYNSWDAGIANYYPLIRDIYTITGISMVTFQSQEQKSSPSSSWVFKTKAFQSYDFVNNVLLERKDLYFDAVNNSWDTTKRTVYTYNGSIDLVAKDIYYFDIDSQKYTARDREENHCAQINVGITEISETNHFTVYPNPVSSSSITINSVEKADYALIDLTGKLLQSGALNEGENRIDINLISAGVYFVKVGNKSKKIISQ
jgi:hypothetical protein